ncbi:glycosyltransferase [Microbaculum marinum]
MRERAIAKFLRHHRVGVVLGEYLDNFIDFIPLLDHLDIPYIAQAHGMDVSRELRQPGMAQRYLSYRSARAVLTRNEFHRQRLIRIGLPAEKVHVNPGGVDIPTELPEKSADSCRRLLAVGLMVPKKAPIFLLEAFRRAAAENPELSLDYVGGGALFPAAQQFVQACGLNDRVRLHGFASEETKLRLLGECGVFVQHSMTTPDGDEEGLPAAIQEAMAHGLAVVSTRHSGISEAVIEGETGILVDEGDVEGMAAALVVIGPSARSLGEAGYRRAAALYAWDHERSRLDGWLSAA